MKRFLAWLLEPLYFKMFQFAAKTGAIMCAQNFAFLMYSPSAVATIGGAAGITTVSLGTSATGLPATAVRLWNAGTQAAFVLMGTATTLTSTGGAGNGMPVPASVSPFVLRTGGQTTIQLGAASTFTTTIYATAGEGVD